MTEDIREPGRADRFRHSALGLFIVLAIAIVLRLWKIGEWSLWEDEMTSVYFAHNPWRPFPTSFPIFFVILNAISRVTDVNAVSGRLVAASFGVLSIALTYEFCRKFLSARVGLVAAVLLTINLGHLFWSQSIRYYTLLLVFELLSIRWFLDGFENRKVSALVLSLVAFTCAMLTHFSALLLAPVLVGYLGLNLLRRESVGAYDFKGYLVFGVPLVASLAVFIPFIRRMQTMVVTDMSSTPARDPVHILITFVAYCGVPLVVLGGLGPFLGRRMPQRVRLLLLLTSVVPVLELVVIVLVTKVQVTWYYAFIAVVALAILAAAALVVLFERRRYALTALLALAVGAYHAVFIFGYFTTMHGDRPRWKEAAAYLQSTPEFTRAESAALYASVPGITAYYLGIDPATTLDQTRVRPVPPNPSSLDLVGDQWFVVEAKLVSADYTAWFAEKCMLKAAFEARTGPADRSVLVYRCQVDPD